MGGVYKFDEFELDTISYALRRNGGSLRVEPLVFNLLFFLIQRAGKLVTRDELVRSVWSGRIMSDGTISTAVKSARKVLGDTGEAQRYIRTVRGRGFEFVGEVECLSRDDIATQNNAVDIDCRAKLHVRSIYNGIDDFIDITSKALGARLRSILNRIPSLCVASTPKNVGIADNAIGVPKSRGTDFVLDLHVSKLNDKLCANVSLTDALKGVQMWVKNFEVAINIAPQELMLQKILTHAEPAIIAAIDNDKDK